MENLVSIIIPSYNEESNIKNTAQTILKIMENANINCELIFVSDKYIKEIYFDCPFCEDEKIADEQIRPEKQKYIHRCKVPEEFDDNIIYQDDILNYEAFIVSAKDDVDGDIGSSVEHNIIDTSEVGEYKLEYKVKDNAGNECLYTITIK